MKTTEAWKADIVKARVYRRFSDPRLNDIATHFESNQEAFYMWSHLPKGVRAAFRGAGDATPVYSHDYVDRL